MKQFIITLCMSVFVSALYAQTISGYIKDAENGTPLPSVNIFNIDSKKGTVTDINGYFSITFNKPGEITLQFSYVGYETVKKSFILKPNDTVKVNIQLQPTVVENKEIVISAGYQSVQNEIPIPIKKIALSQPENQGDISLSQTLEKVPGVNTIKTGLSIGKPVIRGMSYNRVLVYAMGIPIDNQQWGDEHGLSITTLGIDGVEIIKGPASLIYGADAMGGVLHFIDEKPALTNTLETHISEQYHSNTNGFNTIFHTKGATEKLRFGLAGSFKNHADYQQGNGIRVTNTRFQNTAFKGNLGYIFKHWVTDVRMAFNQLMIGIPEEINFQNSDKNLLAPNQLVTDQVLSWENTIFVKHHKIKLNLGYLQNVRKEYEDKAFPVKLYRDYNDSAALSMFLKTMNYNLKWYLPKIKKAEIIIGSQGKQQQNTNFNNEEFLIPDAVINQVGFFGVVKLPVKKWQVLSGIRYDIKNIHTTQIGTLGQDPFFPEIKRQFSSINGSFGVTRPISEKLLMRVNFATGFRAPNLAELSSNGIHEGTFRYEIGNANLNIEHNLEPDISLEYTSKHFAFIVNGFYNNVYNYIYLAPTNQTINNTKVYTYQQTNAQLYGFESTLDIHPHPYDWLHLELNFATVTGKNKLGEYLPRIPQNNGNIILKANLKDGKTLKKTFLLFNVNYLFPQNHFGKFETPTPDYTLLNVKIGGEIKNNITWFAGVNNLLNTSYVTHLSRLKYKNIYNIGRNITVGLQLHFNTKLKTQK